MMDSRHQNNQSMKNRGRGISVGYKITMRVAVFLILFLLLALLPAISSAEIYQWKDAQGNTVFTDTPPAGVSAREMMLKSNNRTEMTHQHRGSRETGDQEAETGLRDVGDINVILYETSWCPYCKKARAYLISRGVRLTEYDVEKDEEKAEEMWHESGSDAIPVIDIEGTVIRGYSPAAIDAAIGAKRRRRD
jgi:glutaredoxin-like YruB-family protein